MADAQTDLVPVTVLTGYLGAGKTTLLNRILSENHGQKYAVVINEFGELGVDNDLVVDTDEEVFEMNNGCICCTVRGDLIRIVNGLMKRRDKFDGIIIETTGLANPAPVAQTFFVDEGVRARTRLDAIVTVVDAKHLPQRLEDSHEAEDQIAFADVIVLNKTDLVTPDELAAVEQQIRRINKFAKIHHSTKANVPVTELLNQGAFDLKRVLAEVPDFLTDDAHEHNDDITSVSCEVENPIDPERFNAWIGALLAERGPDLLRTKGILAYEGDDRRFAFQAVHMIADGDYIGPWKAGEPRTSRIVFIGRNLNRPQLRRGFEFLPGHMSEIVSPDYLLETRGVSATVDAFVVAAAFERAGGRAAFALGDGTLRVVKLGASDFQAVAAHDGAALALAADAADAGWISGGDDGRLVRIASDNTVGEVGKFGSRWVEHVASFADGKTRLLACGVGKFLHLLDGAGAALKKLEHPSSVTGLTFDAKGKRVLASHYNGASLWFVASKSDNARKLEWKGSHIGIAISPDGDAVVTAMQENALHGWRLSDGQHMRMTGYPGKTRSLSFTKNGKWLATSGADAIVIWPFFGGGPMGKPPTELAGGDGITCSAVACHPVQEAVAAGFSDGLVVLADIGSARILPVVGPGRGAVSALAWSPDGTHLAIGSETGFCAVVDFSKR